MTDCEAKADLCDGIAWIAYAGMFLVIPFAVVFFRLQMDAVHYYLAGGVFVACAILFFAMDGVSTQLRKKAKTARYASCARSDHALRVPSRVY